MQENFKEILQEDVKEMAGKFTPYGHLSEGSGALTIYFSDKSDYSEVLNDHITLYKSIDTKEVVGLRIDDFEKFLQLKEKS